ncbi:MAG: hypothetical protein F4219_10145 [Gammaproteobacteria bacterium]|nr:hypothetical protein [Gammaproteobacteria bacterium]
MNTYRINYKPKMHGIRFVQADNVNGFQPTSDTYTFKIGEEVVVAIPKNVVLSIDKVKTTSDEE